MAHDLLVASFGTALLSAVAGFGGGVVLLPVFVALFGARDAVAVLTIAQLASNGSRVWFNRHEIDGRLVRIFAAGAIPAAAAGALLLTAGAGAHASSRHSPALGLIMDVPVQYFQSVIAVQLAIAGALLFQIRFFDSDPAAREQSRSDPWVRLVIGIVLISTIFGSLEAIREGMGRLVAVLVTVGVAVSGVPILLRVLPPLGRDAQTGERHPQFPVTVLGLIVYAAVTGLIISID